MLGSVVRSGLFPPSVPAGRSYIERCCASACAEENTRVGERTPWAKRRSEQRKADAALRYYLEMESRKVGWGDPALVYDEEKDLFRLQTVASPSPASTQTGHYSGKGGG